MSLRTKLSLDRREYAAALNAAANDMDRYAQRVGRASQFSSRQFAQMSAGARRQVLEQQRLTRTTQAHATAMRRAGGGTRNAGFAALEFSRAVEDAQYGMRGVLNNVPGLVQSLGGKAGLAGVLSLAAVAGFQLYKQLEKLGGVSREVEEAARDEVQAQIDARKADEERAATKKQLAEEQNRYVQSVERQIHQMEALEKVEEREIQRLQRKREMQDRIALARDAAGLESRDEVGVELGRRVEDLGREQKRLKDLENLGADVADKRLVARDNAEADQQFYRSRARSAQDKVDYLTLRLAEIAAGSPQIDGFKGRSDFGNAKEYAAYVERNRSKLGARTNQMGINNLDNLIRVRGSLMEAEDALFEANARAEAAAQGSRDAINKWTATQEKVLDSIQASRDRIDVLEQEIGTLRQIQAASSVVRSVVPEGVESIAQSMVTAAKGVVERKVALQEQDGRRGAVAADLMALRLEAGGQMKAAEELRRQLRIREEGKRMAEQLGLTEREGIALAREKARLEEKIRREKERQGETEKESEERARGRIRLYNAEESAERRAERQAQGGEVRGLRRRGLRVGSLQGSGGLSSRVEEQAGRMSAAERERSRDSALAQQMAEVVENQKELLKVWQRITSV